MTTLLSNKDTLSRSFQVLQVHLGVIRNGLHKLSNETL